MKGWNGLGSAFLHGNCAQYCHDNLQPGRKKKQEMRGNNEREWWRMTGQALTHSPSQLPALTPSPLSELILFHESQMCKSDNHLFSKTPDAASVMELFRCEKTISHYIDMMAVLMCHQNKIWHPATSMDPAVQLSLESTMTYTSLKSTVKVIPSGHGEIICFVC